MVGEDVPGSGHVVRALDDVQLAVVLLEKIRPKYVGSVLWWSPSVKVLWSSQTCVSRTTTALSYSEFQLPTEVSVGSPLGEQSSGLSKVRLRTMTLSTALIWRLAPLNPAPLPRPTRVVLAGISALMAVSWLAAEARRRPSGLSSGSASRFVPYPSSLASTFCR